MPYNSETSEYERRATTVIDATPDGDTVAVAIDVKLDQGIDDYVTDLNHHAANGRHYPATSVADDSRFLKQSPAGVVSWADGVVAADAALKDFSNVASGAIAPAKIAQDASNRFVTDAEKAHWNNLSHRNLIINGDFRINQRGYVSGTATTTANQYTLDRWRVVTSGQNVTFTNYLNGRQVTAPAGGIEQVVEDLNIAGGTYVLNWEGTATAAVNGTIVAKGGSFTLPAKTHATVRFTGGTVARVQLEQGAIVTPFDVVDIGEELAKCKRYLPVVATSGVGILAQGYATSTTGGIVNIPISPTPRVPPTGLMVVGWIGNYGFQTSALQAGGLTSLSFVNASFDFVRASFVASASYTATLPGELYTGAGNFRLLFTGCEL